MTVTVTSAVCPTETDSGANDFATDRSQEGRGVVATVVAGGSTVSGSKMSYGATHPCAVHGEAIQTQ